MRVKINVTGIVQGVGFRPFIFRSAIKNKLTGYVQNRGDAGVEILLEGDTQDVQTFLAFLRKEKPPLAQIHNIITKTLTGKNEYAQFAINPSSEEAEYSGSVVPPDIGICNDCLRELRDPKDPRFNYFFITCTNCGPRFTIIEKLPYDRQNTTMREFSLCGFCQKEYESPLNRRFHAQTVACPNCGPKVYLTTSTGEAIKTLDPIREAGKLISQGNIVAIKGFGGFHIAASAEKQEPLLALRESKNRRTKPFALMARYLEAVLTFAEVNSKEQALLTSPMRPIVLLNKNSKYNLSGLIAPELHNVGVMLPYSAMHYMLFDHVDDVAFVMTSANPPNQPMIKENDEALETIGKTADYFLFHNRSIAHRCDDSVLRVHGGRDVFLRRSRGYAPAPIMLKAKSHRCVLGLGGELNSTCCILNENKAFLSQHIGDVENLETLRFLKEATAHLIQLTNSHIDTVACDLHPKFNTTNLAKELAEEKDWSLVQVQHHHAHVAALMAEHGVDEIVGIACDGYGYGLAGEAWGGEILFCKRESQNFKRLGHLQEQPLLGGDLATYFPLRIAAGVLCKHINVDSWIRQNSASFPHDGIEAELVIEQLARKQCISQTTSLGRILDAAAAIVGVCYERTFEGEPAMKLESTAVKGKDVLGLPAIICGDVVDTSQMLLKVYENRNKIRKADLAYSVHSYLARALAELATEKAIELKVNNVGFTGGAAVNGLLSKIMREVVEASGLHFLVHESLPAGDGGVSFGQAVVGGFCRF